MHTGGNVFIKNVILLSVEVQRYLRHGEAQCQDPDGHDELDCPRQLGDRVGEEWVADGDVPLDGEGSYGQHCGVGSCLRRVGSHLTEYLAEDIRVSAHKTTI